MKLMQIHDNEWIKPKMKGFIHECCDCWLRHSVDFNVFFEDKNNPIEMRFKRLDIKRKIGFDEFRKEIEDIFWELGINQSVDVRKLYKKLNQYI